MPPKAQMSTARRGRPAKGAAPVKPLSLPTKRGRVAKASASGAATVEPPKKRGRPAKIEVDDPIAQIDNAIKRGRRSVAAAEEVVADAPVAIKKRAGRPAKTAVTVAAVAAAPKKHAGRPPKQSVAAEAPATPKRRGRPPLDLNRVTGSSRVAKRTSPRIDPKTRPRPRQRAGPVEKLTQAVKPVKKARGRPRKVEIEVEAPAPRKPVGRGRKPGVSIPAAPAKKVTARPKIAIPRKRRGYTSFEVADKFATQVRQFITDLQAEDAANAAAAAGEADDEGEEVEVEVELGLENGTAGSSDDLLEKEPAAELGPEDEERMLIDPTDGANEAAIDQDLLARDEEAADHPAFANDELDDETELPSETAVLADIAAVQTELNVQDTIQDDVHMAEVDRPELERQTSANSVSVDLHGDITEVVSIPQVDGSNNIDVVHTQVNKHIHQHTHIPKPVAPAPTVSLFTGF